MTNSESHLQHFVSLFTTSAFLDDFNGTLSADIAMSAVLAQGTSVLKQSSEGRAIPLASLLGKVQELCGRVVVTSEEGLEELLKAIPRLFEAVTCDQHDRQDLLEDLHDSFESAAWAARETWQEAVLGFPSSGGNFATWKRELWNRKHGFATPTVKR